jgi:hypothetical protein
MDAPLATVIAATITGGLALIGALVNKARKENAEDHEYVQGLLSMLYKSQTRIERKIERVDERLSDHLEFHAAGGMLDNGRTVHQDGVEENSRVS